MPTYQQGQYYNEFGGVANYNPWTGSQLAPGETFMSPNTVTGPTTPPTGTQPTYSPNQNTTSTTTISNANIMNQIPGMVNQLNNLSNTGLSTNSQGNVQYADGSLYQPQEFVDVDTTEEDKQYNDLLESMKTSLDAQTKSLIDNIQQKYALRREEQKEINRRQKKGYETALLMGGVTGQGSTAQYAPISSGGIVAEQEKYGLKQIADIDAEERDLIAQARAAQESGNFKIMEKKLAMAEEKRAAKIQAATELNKKIAEQNEKLREQSIQSARDFAISDLYSQGIRDVGTIMSELRKQGIQTTAKEISSVLESSGASQIDKVLAEASQNGAPLSVLQKIGTARTPSEAILLAGEYTGDVLDRQYKKAQIAKIYKDIQDSGISSGFGGDPMSLIAYANEYASTGKIPTGIPKGSFGIIAQTAKALPKQKGQIIANSTGVAPTGDTTLQTGLGALSSAIRLAEQLRELDKKRVGGVISGTLGKIFGSSDQARYVDLRSQIVDLLSRARSGAALTESEERRYGNMLPGRFSEPLGLGAQSNVRIDNFIKNLSDDLSNKSAAQGWSVYGMTKINTPVGEKLVGETITMSDGSSWRVNADGTLTSI